MSFLLKVKEKLAVTEGGFQVVLNMLRIKMSSREMDYAVVWEVILDVMIIFFPFHFSPLESTVTDHIL